MNKYPLDQRGIDNIASALVKHNASHVKLNNKLADLLRLAMAELSDSEDTIDWWEKAERLLKSIHQRTMDFENLRFDQNNGHKQDLLSPYKDEISDKVDDTSVEGEMTEEELARHFGEPLQKKKKLDSITHKMSLEEIQEWEKRQDNSNDIYKIKARIKNLAVGAVNGNLTPQGEMIVNTFVHSIKAFYDFAQTIQDKEAKIKLTDLIKTQEQMPANLISALSVGVKTK